MLSKNTRWCWGAAQGGHVIRTVVRDLFALFCFWLPPKKKPRSQGDFIIKNKLMGYILEKKFEGSHSELQCLMTTGSWLAEILPCLLLQEAAVCDSGPHSVSCLLRADGSHRPFCAMETLKNKKDKVLPGDQLDKVKNSLERTYGIWTISK